MENLNLNLLKYFYMVVNEKNITKASEKLMISQPAVTRAIRELENSLGVKLLERSKKGVVPTSEGLILYEHTKEILEKVDSTLNIIDLSKGEGKYLYIGTTTTNFTVFLTDTLKMFRKKYPNVHISIILEDMKVLNDLARLGKMDIIIKNDYEEIKNFENIKSFEIEDKFIASRNYFPELAKKKFSLQELLDYPLVLLSNITHGRRNFDDYLNSLGISFKPTYEFNSYSLCRELMSEGFGISIGNPIHYLEDEYIIVKTDFNLPIRTFNIGYLTSSKNELINNFTALLEDEKLWNYRIYFIYIKFSFSFFY